MPSIAAWFRFGSGFAAASPPWRKPKRGHAWRSVLIFLASIIAMHIGLVWWLDFGPPTIRDPEFGIRLSRVQRQTAEHPDRPLVILLGSSRTSMGIRPSAVEPRPGEPMFLNMAFAGGGPILELMVFRRVIQAGYQPKLVLVEYWPAFYEEAGIYHEGRRTESVRVAPADLPTVDEFFPESEQMRIHKHMDERRLNPFLAHRKMLMNRISPSWLPYQQRFDAVWDNLDEWGWLPGRESIPEEKLDEAMRSTAGYYEPLFANYEIPKDADRAMRTLVAECREREIPVALFYLPESAAFRNLMPAKAQKLADEHLQRVRVELNLPLIDTRGWVSDKWLPDGFHLVQAGATEFTKKFIPAVVKRFPEMSDR